MEVENPFGYINSINNKYHLSDKKGYSPFLTDRFFSYFREGILLANIANKFDNVSQEGHYDFWYNSIQKRKRFVKKWHKKVSENDQIQMIAERYQLNRGRAKETLKLFSEDELKSLEEWWKLK